MDRDGYEGYFPECHQEYVRYQEDSNLVYTLLSEFQDEVLTGFEGTYKCNLEGDATCILSSFGIDSKLIYVLDTDYTNY